MAIGMLIAMPIGYRFTHVCGSEDLRLMNAHWVKVANEITLTVILLVTSLLYLLQATPQRSLTMKSLTAF